MSFMAQAKASWPNLWVIFFSSTPEPVGDMKWFLES